MRLVFKADKSTYDLIKHLQKNVCPEDSMASIVTDSIHFLFQIEMLLGAGFKFAIVDPSGQQHFITKKSLTKEEEEDESESDEG